MSSSYSANHSEEMNSDSFSKVKRTMKRLENGKRKKKKKST